MLDENLPAFFLKNAASGIKHHRDIYLSHHGSDPAPAYALQNADPASTSPQHKNCYGAALFDAYNPDVLFGEVLARPDWTQPTLSAEEIRRNGGVPPPPQPMLPRDFNVQLYNPDQQVRIDVKEGKWGASDSYEFSLPQSTFRTPSASNLDRGQSDPASLAITPKVFFVWRKESKLSKDLTCYMIGKSTDTETKKKSKRDPDIAIALWRNMRELTIYETNLQRLDMEDPKGMEVVLLLSAVTLKDLFFASSHSQREAFNINEPDRKLSGGGRKLSNPNRMPNTVSIVGAPALSHHPPTMHNQRLNSSSAPPSSVQHHRPPQVNGTPRPAQSVPPPPLADPRSQWELDAETARLKAQAETEAKEEKRRQKEKARADEAERKRLQRMVEEEEKATRKKQAEIEKETERLRKLYGVPVPVPVPANSSRPSTAPHRPLRQQQQQGRRPAQPPRPMYLQPGGSASAAMMSGANGSASSSTLNLGATAAQRPQKKKSGFLGGLLG